MLARYEDITSRIKEKPNWYDENGVPRYGIFKPDLTPDIYANEIVLLRIACQDCDKEFLVEMSWGYHQKIWDRHAESFSTRMREWIKKGEDKKETWPPLHYGDPPIHDCVGDTMNCIDIEVIEFWKKEDFDWQRIKKFEIGLEGREK